MMCTTCFSLKIFWSPLVEFYYLKSFGKRKSWIISVQLLLVVGLYFVKGQLEQMLIDKDIFTITAVFTLLTFTVTFHEIAVDGWAVELLHPQNGEYAGSCQSLGYKIGLFISTMLFILLTSEEFCKDKLGYDVPLWTSEIFLEYLLCYILALTLFTAFFVPEKSAHQNEKKEDSKEINVRMTFGIFMDALKNKNVQTFFLYILVARISTSLYQEVGTLYLTSDLGYPKENLSIVKVVVCPINIFLAGYSGALTKQAPFYYLFCVLISFSCVAFYAVFVLFATMPTDRDEQKSSFVYSHVIVVFTLIELLNSLEWTVMF